MRSKIAVPKQGKLIAIIGPTASGKSALAMDLARKFDSEIICADSRTLYKGFDIGTAKPSREDQSEVPHHLLNILEPGESFSVAQFKVLAEAAIQDVWTRSKVPFLVGGSGMYVDAVLFDYQFRSIKGHNDDITKGLTLSELQDRVQRMYPADFEMIDHHNPLRLKQILHRGLSNNGDRGVLKYDCLILGLAPERLTIKQNITNRVNDMLNKEFVQEVEGLIDKYGEGCPQLDIIGYRHARSFLKGEITKQEFIERFIRDDLALAKRQMTWFRRNPTTRWLSRDDNPEKLVSRYLAQSE